LLLTLALQALIGIAQVLKQAPLGLPGELALEVGRYGASIVEVNGARVLRAYGLTAHPNVLGGFLAVGLVLSLPLLQWRFLQPLWWLLWIGLLLSFSRTAWFATAQILPLAMAWLAWREPALRRPLATAGLGLAVILLAGWGFWHGPITTRLDSLITLQPGSPGGAEPLAWTEQRSLQQRAELNAVALHLIASHSLSGVGAGNFPVAMAALRTQFPPDYVHSVPLLLAAEVGLTGSLLWVLPWIATLGIVIKAKRSLTAWPIVSICAAFMLAIISLFDLYPWATADGRLLAVTVLALVAVSRAGTSA
jgi:O-antigen ligase